MVAQTEGITPSLHLSEDMGMSDEKTVLVPSVEKKEEKGLRRQKLIFVLLLIAYFGNGCAFSIPAPFYPIVAARKNISSTVTGLVFGCFQIAQFLSSPIYGQFLSVIGPGVVCTMGIFLSGGSSILFGFLSKVQDKSLFVIFSFILRVLGGLGESALYTSSFAIVCAESETVTSKFAFLETALAVGYMAGPALGGASYELGGFGLPFWLIGSVVLVNGSVIVALLFPTRDTGANQNTGNILRLLTSPLVWVAMLVIILGAASVNFFEPTLAIHLSQFNLTTIQISSFFMIIALLHSFLAPLYGYLSDNTNTEAPLMMASCIICAIAFLLIGPSPFLPFLPKAIWLNVLSLVLVGTVYSCVIIQPMKCMIDGAIDVGFPKNSKTFGMLAGVHNSVYCFGGFVGPAMGGAMMERVGFELAATTVSAMFMAAFVVLAVFFGYRWSRRSNKVQTCKNGTHHYEASL